MDLMTAALHEVGHALGLSFGNNTFTNEYIDGDIDITSGLFAGMEIPLQQNYNGWISHIDYLSFRTLMSGAWAHGERVIMSAICSEANKQVSGFTDLNSELAPELKITSSDNGTVKLSWIQPLPGQYTVQKCTNLAQANLVTLTNPVSLVQNGGYSMEVPCNDASAFFRIMFIKASQPNTLKVAKSASFTNNVRQLICEH